MVRFFAYLRVVDGLRLLLISSRYTLSVGNATSRKHILVLTQNGEQWLNLVELRPLCHALCVLIPIDKAVIC
jgi:hypothetical protein